jgi:hypothetical protein
MQASVLEEHVARYERNKADLESLISLLLWENEQLHQGVDVPRTVIPPPLTYVVQSARSSGQNSGVSAMASG